MTTTNTYIPVDAREQIANGLSRVLADSYTLYLKTHNYHWNVSGPHFKALHDLFETQYTELAAAIDEIAERIRALGYQAPGSYTDFARLAAVEEDIGQPDAMTMIRRLAEDQELVANTCRGVQSEAAEARDLASDGLLSNRVHLHEKNAWMLRAHLG